MYRSIPAVNILSADLKGRNPPPPPRQKRLQNPGLLVKKYEKTHKDVNLQTEVDHKI